MKSDEIQSLFAKAIEMYAPVEGQPLDLDLSTLQETLTALLLTIAYDGEKGIHKLVGLLMNKTPTRRAMARTSQRPPGQRSKTSIFLSTRPMP